MKTWYKISPLLNNEIKEVKVVKETKKTLVIMEEGNTQRIFKNAECNIYRYFPTYKKAVMFGVRNFARRLFLLKERLQETEIKFEAFKKMHLEKG